MELLNGLKELLFSAVDVQCKCWTVNQLIKNVLMMKQQDQESLAGHCKRFANTVDVAETQWGVSVPTKIGSNKATRDKFLACTFLAGVDQKKHGKVVNELNNTCLTGQNNHPTMVEGAVMMLSHCMGDKQNHRNEQQREVNVETSFVQRKKNVTCCKCEKKGHCANECTAEDSNDGSSVESGQSHNSSNQINWSG